MGIYLSDTGEVEAVQLDTTDRLASDAALALLGPMPAEHDMPIVNGRACWWRQRFPNGAGPGKVPTFTLAIPAPAGTLEAGHGDWIVKDAEGAISVCSPAQFATAFEPVV